MVEHIKKTRSAKTAQLLLLTCIASSVATAANCVADSDEAQLGSAQQKIVLLQKMVGDSEPARRVLQSNDADAMDALEAARQSAVAAKEALDNRCFRQAAEIADGGLKTASKAFRTVSAAQRDGRAEYDDLHSRTVTFMESLAEQPKERQGLAEDDFVGMQRQVGRAESLAQSGKYQEATALLAPVADRLQRRLIEVLDQQTVVYEKTFSGPRDEYSYLLEQMRGYELLVDRVLEERQPSYTSRRSFEDSSKEAMQLKAEAMALAAVGQWPEALPLMEKAVLQYERVIRALGISY